MILLQAALGDHMLTLTGNPSLDKTDPMPVHYTLQFRDLAKGTDESVSCTDEMDGIRLFTAWLWADEDGIVNVSSDMPRVPRWARP